MDDELDPLTVATFLIDRARTLLRDSRPAPVGSPLYDFGLVKARADWDHAATNFLGLLAQAMPDGETDERQPHLFDV